MEIRNASDMMSRAETVGQGCRVTQLHPYGPLGYAILAVDLWEIEPGGFTPLSGHAEEHVMFVISGSGELSGAVASGPTVTVRKDSVAHIGHREVHTLRNTGSELLRVLVSTPLLVRSDRALGFHSYQQSEGAQNDAAAMPAPALAKVAPEPALTSRIKESRPSAADPEEPAAVADHQTMPDAPGQEPPPPDISNLVKRASEVATVPKPERRKPLPVVESEPVAQTEDDQDVAVEEEASSNLMELAVVFDGGSRGNPGQGYGSFMVQTPNTNRKPVIKRVEFGDNYTNNQAEYDTLIESLVYIIERLEATNRSPKQVQLDIKTDSDVVVNQLLGSFKVKDAGLRARHIKAHELLDSFGEWIISWHPREESVRLLGH